MRTFGVRAWQRLGKAVLSGHSRGDGRPAIRLHEGHPFPKGREKQLSLHYVLVLAMRSCLLIYEAPAGVDEGDQAFRT